MRKLKSFIFILGFVIMQASFWIYNTPIYVYADDDKYPGEWAEFAVSTTFHGVRNSILSKYTSLGQYAWMFDAAELGASQMIDYLINGNFTEQGFTSPHSILSFIGLYRAKSDSPIEMLSYTAPPQPDGWNPDSLFRSSSLSFDSFSVSVDDADDFVSYNSMSVYRQYFVVPDITFYTTYSYDYTLTFDSRFDPSSVSYHATNQNVLRTFCIGRLSPQTDVPQIYIPTWILSAPNTYLWDISGSYSPLSASGQNSISHNVSIDVSHGLSNDLINDIKSQIEALYPDSGEDWFIPEYGEPIPTEPETVPKYNDLTYPGNIPDYTMPTYEMESHSIPESAISGAGFWFTQLQNFIENSGLMWLVVLVGLLTILFYLLRW